MLRHFHTLLLVLLLLAACAPAAQPLAPTRPVTEPPPGSVPTVNPTLAPFYTENIPAAVLIVGDQQQTAGIGTASWIVGRSGNEIQQAMIDALGIIAPFEPLAVTSPLTATLRLPVPVKPSRLTYWVGQARGDPRPPPSGRTATSWEADHQPETPLPLEVAQEIALSLEPGRYLLVVDAAWDDLGSVMYGFSMEVQADGDTDGIKKYTYVPTKTSTPLPIITCASLERVYPDSGPGVQISFELTDYFERQPADIHGFFIWHRADILEDWAVIQGSLSDGTKVLLAAQRKPIYFQIVERLTLDPALSTSSGGLEALVAGYFREKLPDAPEEMFTCLDLSWLAGQPQVAAGDVITPTLRETPLALPASLTVEEYRLRIRPVSDSFEFHPFTGTQEQVLTRRLPYREQRYIWSNYSYDYSPFTAYLHDGADVLSATEHYEAADENGWVIVSRNGKEIYRIGVQHGGPISVMRGLWSFDKHWVLETVYIAPSKNDKTVEPTGHVSQDGVDLNEFYGYDATFGFQLMAGKPFYFFKKDGKIGFSYDGQAVEAGYEHIPFYGCCSAASLNPLPAPNMVAFFAVRDSVWYYVEIGVYS